jgi:hypothetical protein
MRVLLIGLLLIAAFSSTIFFLPQAHAAGVISTGSESALTASPDFAFGARLDIGGRHLQASLNAAAGLGLDWIAVDFNWAAIMPDPTLIPDITPLNQVMEAARRSNTPVMLSLTSAPGWASSPNGPDPNLTASLALSLARLYPGTLRAIELYPQANTQIGWGAPPDPARYAALYQATDAALKAQGINMLLVASLAPARVAGDALDYAYLESLYQLGGAGWLQIVGVRLPALVGDAMASPDGEAGLQNGMTVLRHYEILRQVMTD